MEINLNLVFHASVPQSHFEGTQEELAVNLHSKKFSVVKKQ